MESEPGRKMLQVSFTFNKLIVLYMLDRVTFPITVAQISDFVLEQEYIDFLTLQQVINELKDSGLVSAETVRNRTFLTITNEGRETLRLFKIRISIADRQAADAYLYKNEFSLRNEIAVQGRYYKSAAGGYDAHLTAEERDSRLVEITISVPTEEMAADVCDNWQKKNLEIYQYLIGQLF